jgi:xanthine/CO dehydrogenase XdhC/CoxF family maturation factor
MVFDADAEEDVSRVDVDGSRTVFTEVLQPPYRLIVCGAGDDARPLAAFASEAGFAVTVVDHRAAYLTSERFPSAQQLFNVRPDSEGEINALGDNSRSFVVIKTHSFAHDRGWLRFFLKSRASYIGLLGPRARADEILGQLGAAIDGRVYAPVGLNLGADGPEQIAISIVSELLAVLSRQVPGHLRQKGQTIHAF